MRINDLIKKKIGGYNKKPRYCKRCKKEIPREFYPGSLADQNYQNKKYCSSDCARGHKLRVQSGKAVCIKCLIEKTITEFPLGKKRRDGTERYSYCKECHLIYQRDLRLKRLFRISEEEYQKIINHQGNVCAICKQPKRGKNNFSVDHSHKTGLIRGGLCWLCNRALGLFKDNIELFKNAVEYLANPPAIAALGERRYGLIGKAKSKKKMIYGGDTLLKGSDEQAVR
jgi:hypothetical protein